LIRKEEEKSRGFNRLWERKESEMPLLAAFGGKRREKKKFPFIIYTMGGGLPVKFTKEGGKKKGILPFAKKKKKGRKVTPVFERKKKGGKQAKRQNSLEGERGRFLRHEQKGKEKKGEGVPIFRAKKQKNTTQ